MRQEQAAHQARVNVPGTLAWSIKWQALLEKQAQLISRQPPDTAEGAAARAMFDVDIAMLAAEVAVANTEAAARAGQRLVVVTWALVVATLALVVTTIVVGLD